MRPTCSLPKLCWLALVLCGCSSSQDTHDDDPTAGGGGSAMGGGSFGGGAGGTETAGDGGTAHGSGGVEAGGDGTGGDGTGGMGNGGSDHTGGMGGAASGGDGSGGQGTTDPECTSCEEAGGCTQHSCVLGEDVESLESALADVACREIVMPPGIYSIHDAPVTRSVFLRGTSPEETVLDAEGLGRVLTLPGDCGPVTLALEGLTLRGGRAAEGGALLAAEARVELENVIVEDNTASVAGGAIHLRDDSILVAKSSVFRDNWVESHEPQADVQGGALFAQNSKIELESCLLAGNRTTSAVHDGLSSGQVLFGRVQGGAIWILSSSLDIRHTVFEGNAASATGAFAMGSMHGGAIYANNTDVELYDVQMRSSVISVDQCTSCGEQRQGGALFQDRGTLRIEASLFEDNAVSSSIASGGLWRGGALSLGNVRDVAIENSLFSNNAARDGGSHPDGGAIYILKSSALNSAMNVWVEDTGFSNNSAVCAVADGCQQHQNAHGGALRLQANSGALNVTLLRSFAVNNYVTAPGGELTGAAGGFLAATNNMASRIRIVIGNSTISGNHAEGRGGAFYLNPGGASGATSAGIALAVFNSTLAENTAPVAGALFGRTVGAPSADGAGLVFEAKNTILTASGQSTCWFIDTPQGQPHVDDPMHVVRRSLGGLLHQSTGCSIADADGDVVIDGANVPNAGLLPLTQIGSTWVHPLEPASPAYSSLEACTDLEGHVLLLDQCDQERGPSCTLGASAHCE